MANYATDSLGIKLIPEKWDSLQSKPADYEEIPDPSWISFKPAEADIEPEAIAVFQPIITIPNDEKYKGKKYAALIRTGLKTGFWLDAPVKIFITTK